MRPPSGWLSLVTLGLMLLTLTSAIQAMGWTPGLEILSPMVVAAVLVGAALASRAWLPGLLAHSWSLGLALIAAAYLGSFNLSKFDLAPERPSTIWTRMDMVRDLCLDWLRRVRLDLPLDENVARFVFVLWLAILLWLVAYMAAWFLVRYANWWGMVMPSGFALVATLSNAKDDALVYLAAFVLFALILAGQTNTALQFSRWTRQRIGFDADLSVGFLRDGLVLAVAVLAFGCLAPAEAVPTLFREWTTRLLGTTQAASDRLSRVFPSLETTSRSTGSGQGFGDELPLTGSVDLGNQPIFDAVVEPDVVFPRWRMAVYDQFTGTGWRRSATERLAGQVLDASQTAWPALGIVVTQTITALAGGARQLYAIPEAIDFDIPVVSEVALWQGQLTPDVQGIRSQVPLRVGEGYVVRSRVAVDDADALRRAEGTDPEWVRDRYLALPQSTTERTRDLARQIVGDARTRFDQSAAIEAYLRQIPYSIVVSPPPSGQDRVDWFLFDERRGYCDYYASAFVVLARSLGIPARFVAGYAAGDRVPGSQAYRQLGRHAHTWPEVYFPGRGWVAFEPTASQPPLPRSGASAPGTFDAAATSAPTPTALRPAAVATAAAVGPARETRPTRPMGLGVLGLALFAAVGMALGYAWWTRPWWRLTPAEAAFERLHRLGGWLGLRLRPSATPHEFSREVARQVHGVEPQLDVVVSAFVAERFGRKPSLEHASQLRLAWRDIRSQIVRSAPRLFVARIRRPTGRRAVRPVRPAEAVLPPTRPWL